MIHTVPAQISFASEPVLTVGHGYLERHGVTETENLAILGVEARLVALVGFQVHQAAELAVMTGDLAPPNSQPAPLQTVGQRRLSGRGLPIAVKTRTAAGQQ